MAEWLNEMFKYNYSDRAVLNVFPFSSKCIFHVKVFVSKIRKFHLGKRLSDTIKYLAFHTSFAMVLVSTRKLRRKEFCRISTLNIYFKKTENKLYTIIYICRYIRREVSVGCNVFTLRYKCY